MKPIVISGHMTVIIFSCFPCSVCIMHCVIDGPRICSSLAKEIYGHKVQGTWTSVIFEGGVKCWMFTLVQENIILIYNHWGAILHVLYSKVM